MVGFVKEKPVAEWVKSLLESEFFVSCLDHGDMKKNEKNLFCIDCNLCFCKHCIISSSHDCCLHRLLQICRYVYHNVVRLNDIQPHLDCSLIQAYKINGDKAVHLNSRPPQQKDAKSTKTKCGGTCCQACGRHIQDLLNRFCSIECKFSVDSILVSTKTLNIDGVPSLETECESSYENGSASSLSLTDSSSEVIQASWNSDLRPKKRLHKRKGIPRRSPLF